MTKKEVKKIKNRVIDLNNAIEFLEECHPIQFSAGKISLLEGEISFLNNLIRTDEEEIKNE